MSKKVIETKEPNPKEQKPEELMPKFDVDRDLEAVEEIPAPIKRSRSPEYDSIIKRVLDSAKTTFKINNMKVKTAYAPLNLRIQKFNKQSNNLKLKLMVRAKCLYIEKTTEKVEHVVVKPKA
jgi:hypothetical protein